MGKYTAIQVDSIPNEGYCFDVKNFGKQDVSFVIYSDGTLKDININGWLFPFAYNSLTNQTGEDWKGGHYSLIASFEAIDKNGRTVNIKNKTIYGHREVAAVIYFYTMLKNMSICNDIEEFSKLYNLIIDNDKFTYSHDYSEATEILSFIKGFKTKFIDTENEVLAQLKVSIKEKFAKAKTIIIDTELNF